MLDEYQWPINPFTDGDLKALELLNKQTLVKSEDQDKPIPLSENRTTIRSKIKSDNKLTTAINSTIDTYPDDDDSFSNDDNDGGFEPDDINSDDNDEDELPSRNPRKPNPSYNDADDWEPDDINSDDNHEEERPSSTPNKRKRSSKEEDEWKPDDESSSDYNEDEDESFLKSLISKKRKKNKTPTEWKPNNIRKDKDPFRIHRCPHCPAKYTTNAILIIHVKDKHPNVTPPPKAKPGAKRKYPDEFYTSCRTEQVKPRVPSQCPYCSKNYKTIESMKNHIRSSHLLKFDFNCGKCGAGMSNEQLLNGHEALCSGEDPGPKKKCPEEGCLVSVPLMVGLETHFKDKHPDRSLFSKCPICEAGFYTKLGYDRHIQRDHKDIRLFRCDHCGVAFKMKRSLTRHKAKIHGEGELTEVICDHCGLSFVCQYNLNEHVKRMHEDKYKFRCNQCGRGFAEEEPLKVHSFKKHGIGRVEDLRWRCEVEGCGRIFLRRHRYSKHMSMHYDEGKGPQFTCEECGKQFWEKYSLTYHKKGIHESKEKNEKFTCEVCGAEFGFKDYLVRHKRVVHKIFPQRRK